MGGRYSVFRNPFGSLKNAVYTSKEVQERTDDDDDSEHSNESVEATVSSTLETSYRQGTKRRADSSSGPSSKRSHHLTGDTDDEERVSLEEEEEDIFATLQSDDDIGLSNFGLSGDESLSRVNDNLEQDIFSLGDPTLATPSCSFEVSRLSPERSYIGSRQSTRKSFKVSSTFKSESTEFDSEAGPSGLTKTDSRLEGERSLIHDTIQPRRSVTPLQRIHGRGPISRGRQSELSIKVAELSRLSSVGVKIRPETPKLKATSTPKLKQATSPNLKQSSTKASPRKVGKDTVDKAKTSSGSDIKASPRVNRLSNVFKSSLESEVKTSPRRKVKTSPQKEEKASPHKWSKGPKHSLSNEKQSKASRRSLSKEKQSRNESLVLSEENDGRSQSEKKPQSTGKASTPAIKKLISSCIEKQVESKRRSSSREDSGSEHKKVTFKSSVKKHDGDSREKLYKEQNNRRLRTRTSTTIVTSKLQKTGRSHKQEDSGKKDKGKTLSPKEPGKTLGRSRKGSTSPSDKNESLKKESKRSPKKDVKDKGNKTSPKEPAKTGRRTRKGTASPSDKNESLKNKGSPIKNDNKASKSKNTLPEKQPENKRQRKPSQKMLASPSDKNGPLTKVVEASAKKNEESKKTSPAGQAPRRVTRRGVKRSASPPNKVEPSKKSRQVIKEYEVEHILGVRVTKKKGREFLIHWKGFSKSHDSWEPENNLNCTELIQNYLTKE